jgi:hypothetical protein
VFVLLPGLLSGTLGFPSLTLSFFKSTSGGRVPCGHCGWEIHILPGYDFSNHLNFSVSKLVICPPSYVNFRPKTNAVILLDMGRTLRGEHI